ncbi:SPOR domain-containing protein [Gimibacter soli]|uniref:SPOR domain-containing protein n=1 Tax=Gimibacter soli TaxID=3024400 RepID=A0AAF0BL74_9PROT|nr:SPOR domain-containing protein [Gimibacter soli]WCL53130.1 SPOR domain-containing protein [Gimibacter soli]
MSDNPYGQNDRETPPWLQPVPEEEYEEGMFGNRRTMMIVAGGAILLVILFITAIVVLYEDQPDGAPMHVSAPSEPMKVRPEDAGGMKVDHQDKQVFDKAAGIESREDVALGQPAEQPMEALPEEALEGEPGEEGYAPGATDRDTSMPAAADTTAATTTQVTEPEAETTVPAPAAALPQEAAETSFAGKYRIQLGAYGSEPSAEGAAKMLKQKFSGELGGLVPQYERVQAGERALYRLRFGPIEDRAAADQLCLALRSKSQACIVVNP